MSNTKLTVGAKTFDLSQGIPIPKQKWRKHLILVSTLPNRFLGLVEELPPNNRAFTLHSALDYSSQLRFEPAGEPSTPGGPPPLRALAYPQAVLHWDCMDVVTVRISSHCWFMAVHEQTEKLRDFFYASYQNSFSPPQIIKPGAGKLILP